MAKPKRIKKDSEAWMTMGEVRQWIKDARELNSTDTKIWMHGCGQFDGVCLQLRIITDHDICESKES